MKSILVLNYLHIDGLRVLCYFEHVISGILRIFLITRSIDVGLHMFRILSACLNLPSFGLWAGSPNFLVFESQGIQTMMPEPDLRVRPDSVIQTIVSDLTSWFISSYHHHMLVSKMGCLINYCVIYTYMYIYIY